ncbi:beta-propeller fold lactonase family protein [Haploplasma axanthum]|uniref:6-phosphogluconolactonase n=1 Tax=Haploplasma axanthum TaxID=29552 RepID=A0A449BD57_HAPAX|nr:beta-propeller fold lactonase family protein [Haploplasma axanthum]VEU80357.1 6-phosphogluconolactonase [Haploplasma axanthum]
MKILIGSYNKNVYELIIKNNKVNKTNVYLEASKPSYLMNLNGLSYIYEKDNKQYIKIENDDILLNEKSCHISYDKTNNLVYSSHYHDGILKILSKDKNHWDVVNTLSYTPHSHIHYAEYIPSINKVGVCDLGDNKFYLYDVKNKELNLSVLYSFKNNEGPRHFTYNKDLPIIYIINELTPSVSVLEFSNNKLNLLQTINLSIGAGSAIRISKDNKFLYAAVRDSNYIFVFEIEKNGLLKVIQKIHTNGDHPRDFNLIDDDKYLLVANMKSDNLSLYSINNGKLTLEDYNYNLDRGASIISI